MPTLKVWNGTDWEYLTGGAPILQQDAEPGSPVEGDLWIDTDAEPSGSTVRGNLGYAEKTANQGSITSEADITGLSVTVTVNSGERIRIEAQMFISTGAGSPVANMRIKEGATVLQQAQILCTTGTGLTCRSAVVLTPSAGSHTYKVSVQANSGTVAVDAGAGYPAYILVEGIGT